MKRIYNFTKEYAAVMTQMLFVGCILLVIFYGASVFQIISKTVATKSIENQTAAMQGTVQNLDAQYITLSNKITPDLATHFGLHEGSVSAYIDRTPSFGLLTLRPKL